MGGDNVQDRCGLPENRTLISNAEINKERSVASPNSQVKATDESQQDEISWPRATKANATLQVPSRVKRDAVESHEGSTFQRKRTRGFV